MSEDFKNYLANKMQEVTDESAEVSSAVVENKAEELPQEETASDPAEDDEDLAEVVTETVTMNAPKVKENPNGTYHGIFLPVCNTTERIKAELMKRAETDEELAKAIAEGKKTFEGCDRFIRNSMSDLAREMKAKELTMDDDSVHAIAVWYFKNPYATDVQNAVKAVSKAKEAKPKKELKEPKKPTKKEQPKKEKKTAQVVDMFAGFFGEDE